MPTLTIGPLTVASGTVVLGPITTGGSWSLLDLQFDIANLVQADLFAETSPDGVQWAPLSAETQCSIRLAGRTGLPVTTEHLAVQRDHADPASQLRIRLVNGTAFLSTGGTLVVS